MPDVLVSEFPPPKGHGELDLVAAQEEIARVLELEGVVVALDLGPHLDFLQLHLVLLLLGLAGAPVLLVLELAVIHDAAHRRAGGGRDLDQIEPLRLGERESLAHRQHPDLLPVVRDHANLRDADALVDSNFRLLDWRNGHHLRGCG